MAESLESSKALRLWLPLGAGLVTYSIVLARGGMLLSDPDVYLHVAVGRWIIEHRAVPHEDVFSHTMRGAPWVPHEWLSEVMAAYAFDYAGWFGLVVLTGLAFALALAYMTRALLRDLAPSYALIGAITAWGMCFPYLLARPHVLAYPMLVAWLAALVAARSEDRAPSPFAALLMVVWANLHGSFFIGLVLAAFIGGEALFDARDRNEIRRIVLHWGIFGLLSLAAATVTPNGIAGLLLPLDLARSSFALSWIAEWKSPNFQQPQPIEVWLMLLLLGALLLGLRLPITRIAMLLFVLHMALQHTRHVALLGLAAPFLLANSLAAQLPKKPEKTIAALFKAGSGTLAAASGVTALVVVFALAVGTTVLRLGIEHDVDRFTPSAALAVARQNQITGPVFNDFNFGGFLIFSGVSTFIDGRADMYGDSFLKQYVRRDELPQLLSKYKITWTLLGAEHSAVSLLDRLPGWRRLYADNIAVIHVPDKAPEP